MTRAILVFHIMIMIRTKKDDVSVITNTTAIPVYKPHTPNKNIKIV